jgi:hypothetical protein
MLHCQAHIPARQKLWNSTGGRNIINMMKIFTTTKMLHALFIYVAETGRWNGTLREIPTLEREGENRRGRKR